MDNKELQRAVNPVYLTAKGTLGLLNKAGDPDAVALLPIIGLETELQEKAKVLPVPIGLCYKTAQLVRYEIYNTAALRSSAACPATIIPADQGTDYAGPESGEKIVGCGGCYDSEPYACTQSYHGREIQHNGRNATLGFRIVLRKR